MQTCTKSGMVRPRWLKHDFSLQPRTALAHSCFAAIGMFEENLGYMEERAHGCQTPKSGSKSRQNNEKNIIAASWTGLERLAGFKRLCREPPRSLTMKSYIEEVRTIMLCQRGGWGGSARPK